MPRPERTITDLLLSIQAEPMRQGELSERLYSSAYPYLHEMATRIMARERKGHTLEPMALVHEAFVKLVDQSRADFRNRSHFLAVAARIMRRVLVDHARGRSREKRGGAWTRVTLNEEIATHDLDALEVLALEQALHRLETLHPRMGRVVELKMFGGMTMQEIALALDVSERTCYDDWTFARLWLARELHPSGASRE